MSESEENRQKQNEINRKKIFEEKIEKFEEYNVKRNEGKERQLKKIENIKKRKQKQKE